MDLFERLYDSEKNTVCGMVTHTLARTHTHTHTRFRVKQKKTSTFKLGDEAPVDD